MLCRSAIVRISESELRFFFSYPAILYLHCRGRFQLYPSLFYMLSGIDSLCMLTDAYCLYFVIFLGFIIDLYELYLLEFIINYINKFFIFYFNPLVYHALNCTYVCMHLYNLLFFFYLYSSPYLHLSIYPISLIQFHAPMNFYSGILCFPRILFRLSAFMCP